MAKKKKKADNKNMLMLFAILLILVFVYLVMCTQNCPALTNLEELTTIEDY